MVSRQSFRRTPGLVAGIAGTVSLLALTGCQHLSRKVDAPPPAVEPPPRVAAPAAPAAPSQTAVEAACLAATDLRTAAMPAPAAGTGHEGQCAAEHT